MQVYYYDDNNNRNDYVSSKGVYTLFCKQVYSLAVDYIVERYRKTTGKER